MEQARGCSLGRGGESALRRTMAEASTGLDPPHVTTAHLRGHDGGLVWICGYG